LRHKRLGASEFLLTWDRATAQRLHIERRRRVQILRLWGS
jgi:hypothetical protein